MIDHSIGIPRAQTNHLHSGRLPLEQVFNSTLRNATLTLAQESHGGVQEPKLIIIIGKLFRSDTFTPDAFTNLLEKSAPKKDGPRHFRRGGVHLERPNLTGAIFAVFFRNELIFGMNTHLSSQSSLHYLSGRAEKETIKNRPFFTFSWLPEADIYSPNLQMVLYHVFGVATFFGTNLEFHSEWSTASEVTSDSFSQKKF